MNIQILHRSLVYKSNGYKETPHDCVLFGAVTFLVYVMSTDLESIPNVCFIRFHVCCSAGSIPDSYDIYRYLNLFRYSIFDTFVVNVISSTYSGAT